MKIIINVGFSLCITKSDILKVLVLPTFLSTASGRNGCLLLLVLVENERKIVKTIFGIDNIRDY